MVLEDLLEPAYLILTHSIGPCVVVVERVE
jgi:hypothetical protein